MVAICLSKCGVTLAISMLGKEYCSLIGQSW